MSLTGCFNRISHAANVETLGSIDFLERTLHLGVGLTLSPFRSREAALRTANLGSEAT